ncbi:hypothetical protein SEA_TIPSYTHETREX_32 [Mycobacterium phage TipsytheTRex]|nr:hypothetical protein SEA_TIPSYTHETREX_32 [Mycobacterium phage TipsytheTRex]
MKKLVLSLSAVAAVLVACSQEPSAAPSQTEEKRGTVVYEVGGDISYASYDDNLESGIEYPAGVTRVELSGDDVPQEPKGLYTWANTSEGRESQAWCRITVDGKVVAEVHKTGEANDPMCFFPEIEGVQ